MKTLRSPLVVVAATLFGESVKGTMALGGLLGLSTFAFACSDDAPAPFADDDGSGGSTSAAGGASGSACDAPVALLSSRAEALGCADPVEDNLDLCEAIHDDGCGPELDAFLTCADMQPLSAWLCFGDDGAGLMEGNCEAEAMAMASCLNA